MLIRVDISSGIARIHLSGLASHEGYLDAFEQMIQHPDFESGMNSIWDASSTDMSQFSVEELRSFSAFADRHAEIRGRARGALVIPSGEDSGLDAMARAIEDISLPVEMRVFRDIGAAEEWLASGDVDA
ncbi:MAG: hypothetical protein ACE5FL_01185 [Myxococcota bacterium]